MAWDVTTWTAADHGTATIMNSRIKGNFDAIGTTQTYVPTFGGTGWAKGNGTLVAHYWAFGNRVDLGVKFTLGTTSTGGTGGLTLTYPTSAPSMTGMTCTGKLSKGGVAFACIVEFGPATISVNYLAAATGNYAGLVNAQPSAGNYTTGDIIQFFGSFDV